MNVESWLPTPNTSRRSSLNTTLLGQAHRKQNKSQQSQARNWIAAYIIAQNRDLGRPRFLVRLGRSALQPEQQFWVAVSRLRVQRGVGADGGDQGHTGFDLGFFSARERAGDMDLRGICDSLGLRGEVGRGQRYAGTERDGDSMGFERLHLKREHAGLAALSGLIDAGDGGFHP